MEIGAFEILAVAVIALLFFGPSKLPQLGKSVGEAIRGFKKGLNDVQGELKDVEHQARKTTTNPRQDFPGATPDAAPDEKVTVDIVKEPAGSGRNE